MPVFPSEDWVQALCERIEEHPEAGGTAAMLEGVYRFVIEPAGPLTVRHVYAIGIGPDDNGGATATAVPVGDDVRLELRADYHNWRRLISGQLDLGMAVMFRRLKVSGDVATLTRNLSTARPLADALGSVDTVWLES